MFLSRISTTLLRPTTPATFSWSRSLSSQVNEAVNATVTSSSAKEDKIVMAKKTNIAQSPLRMKFLARLVRGTWVPDAMAQMKFSPKHRAEDVLKIIQVCYYSTSILHNRTDSHFISHLYRELMPLLKSITELFQRS